MARYRTGLNAVAWTAVGLALVLWGIAAAAGVHGPVRAAGSASVTIQGFAFAPATLEVTIGTTVIWTNRDAATHTVTSNTGAWPDSGGIATGSIFSYTFTVAGTYPYDCAIHPMMTATIVVVDAAPPAAATPADTATTAPTASDTATAAPAATNTATWSATATATSPPTATATATSTAGRTPVPTATPAMSAPSSAPPGSGVGQQQGGSMGPMTTKALPGFVGYFEGKHVRALVTDTSSKALAARGHVNYAPALKGTLARTIPIYLVANGRYSAQGAVFDSIPGDRRYSPLHEEVLITWKNPRAAVPLASSTQIAALVRTGKLAVQRTGIVLDCPIIAAG